MTPTIVLCECIVQRRCLFFVKLCFDNIMSIIMKVSYMKSNNYRYHHLPKTFIRELWSQVNVETRINENEIPNDFVLTQIKLTMTNDLTC